MTWHVRILGLAACVAFGEFAQAGAICEYKIHQAKVGLEAYENKPNPNQKKLQEARTELESLLKHCDDEGILGEVRANIAATKSRLDQANVALAQVKEMNGGMNDRAALQQALLAQKIAQAQYIAARQEELRLKDLLKPLPKP